MTTRNNILTILCIAAALPGCAQFNTAYRAFSVDDGTGALIDIKQRAIIATQVIDRDNDNKVTTETDWLGGSHPIKKTRVCAEPSPDALSAYAAEVAGSGIMPSGEAVKLAAAFQEGASYVGLRTQTIQLLRDGLYRLCEDYINGSDSLEEHELKQRRFQKVMVGMLAIEQLTGAIKSPPVIIDTKGSAEAGHNLSEFTNELTKSNIAIQDRSAKINLASKEIADYDTQIKSLDGKTDDASKQKLKDLTDKKAAAEKNKAQLEQEKSVYEENKKALEAGIQYSRDLVVSGTTTSQVSNIGMPAQPANVAAVSDAVSKIADSIISVDDTPAECFILQMKGKIVGSWLEEPCKEIFKGIAKNLYNQTAESNRNSTSTNNGALKHTSKGLWSLPPR